MNPLQHKKFQISQLFFIVFVLTFLSTPFVQAKKHPTQKAPDIQSIMRKNSLGRYVLKWGKNFRKFIPDNWTMELGLSQTKQIQWNASPHIGYKIIFTHRKKHVVVPKPHPSIKHIGKNTILTYQRCSLHFFPRTGEYKAYESFIFKVTPARLLLVTKKALIFQPNRFLHKEYPCPEIIRPLFTTYSSIKKYKNIKLKQLLKNSKAKLYKYALIITLHQKKYIPWKQLFRHFKRKTMIIKIRKNGYQDIKITHIDLRK